MHILLLGNGFDIHHSLPTKYINFLNTINYLISWYDGKNMKTVADVFNDMAIKGIDCDIKDSLDKYMEEYKKLAIDNDKIANLIQRAKECKWFLYLTRSFNKDIGWIDFEQEVAKVIAIYKSALVNDSERFRYSNTDLKEKQAEYVFDHLISFYDVVGGYFQQPTELARYVKKQYLIEWPLGSGSFKIDVQKIIDELYSDLRKLAKLLIEYLSIFVESVSKELLNKFEKNPDFVADKVITFNYTGTYENLYGDNDIISHIHGKIDSEIVLGVNSSCEDELDNLNTNFLKFKKYFQRVFYKTDTKYLEWLSKLRLARINDSTKKLTIVGHSLDLTDEEVLKELILWAKTIVVFYYSENDVSKYIKNLVSMFGKKRFDEIRKGNKIEFRQLKGIKLR